MAAQPVRNLNIVLGDQLDRASTALADVHPQTDVVVMMEVDEEASYVPQHRLRIAFFLAAMRHHRDAMRRRGLTVLYSEMDDPANRGSFASELTRRVAEVGCERLIVTKPGDHRVETALRETAAGLGKPLEVRDDHHFIVQPKEFEAFAAGRKSLLMETFYRQVRSRIGALMDGDEPVGGAWNLDRENRASFGKGGPPEIAPPLGFAPDATTQGAIDLVRKRFANSPGSLDRFDYPVTRDQARAALADFVDHRLEHFDRFQDAMALGRPFLYHGRLSCVLNLHLLDPREAVAAAEEACLAGRAPLNSAEGFVRQIIGWREYIRGVYWREMPGYAERNALDADLPAPKFLWTGETDMACVRAAVGQLVDHAYAHHIQRLMVLGLLNLLLGVNPYAVHRWHMSMFADAVDWVSLPNVLGMSQYGDGGLVGTKPYCASGNYIDRMSDYCRSCRYDPKRATGANACPFTSLYWDFLARHKGRFAANRRMGMQLRNLERKPESEVRAIRRHAERLRAAMTAETWSGTVR
ncbi:MAG: cryptochrome/photolyase family protein [Rhodospirillales bacterium]|nr:cryptochrome/photolyase family protein [Rhodospirillales bacterium]